MKKIAMMLGILTLTGVVSGVSLALINQKVEPRVLEQQARAIREAVLAVVPGAVQFTEKKLDVETVYYEVFDAEGKLAGYSLPGQGMGYGGQINLIIGVTPDFKKSTGLKVLENVETPGLGGKIGEKAFQAGFLGLVLEPAVALVKGARTKDNEIPAITGATISSRAVVNIVNGLIKKYRPLILKENQTVNPQ